MGDKKGLKIIFLDTNGVLNFTNHRVKQLKKGKSIEFSYMELSEEALQLVGKLREESNAIVVVTSSWRRYNNTHATGFNNLKKQLKEKAGVEVFSTTPLLGEDAEKNDEIKEWFNQNTHLNIESYVIIDDEPLVDYEEKLVKCDRDYGFTSKALYEEAYKILNEAI